VTGVTVGKVNAVPQVLAGTVSTGIGNTTKFLVFVQPGAGVVYVAVKQPAVVAVNTPVGVIVPPPLTVQVPPVAPPDWVKVTELFIQVLVVVTTGKGFIVTVRVALTAGQEDVLFVVRVKITVPV
jgi:hypothetical protein